MKKVLKQLRSLAREPLAELVAANVRTLTEEEALDVLANRWVTPQILQTIAQNQRLTGFYSIRVRLVAHRGTPQAHAVKLVHYLHWPDMVRLSVDVRVPAPVRRALDTQLLLRVDKLSLGEKISSAKRCSPALIKALLFDPDPKVFAALLVNQRLREEDLVLLAGSDRATAEKLHLLAEDRKWSHRYAIRKALAMNPTTPRAVAASQLRFLTSRDLGHIHSNPATSVYVRRCIERLQERGRLARTDRASSPDR
jgi:hypothetical protein